MYLKTFHSFDICNILPMIGLAFRSRAMVKQLERFIRL